jgi:hypothetical protein
VPRTGRLEGSALRRFRVEATVPVAFGRLAGSVSVVVWRAKDRDGPITAWAAGEVGRVATWLASLGAEDVAVTPLEADPLATPDPCEPLTAFWALVVPGVAAQAVAVAAAPLPSGRPDTGRPADSEGGD